MLEVRNLRKNYGSLEVLKDISFKIDKGKIYGFLGENGAGKTTTMNILTGLISYSSGEILLDGEDFKRNKHSLLKKVGYLPQSPVFYGYMTAFEYLNFIGEISGMSKKSIKERINTLLEVVELKNAAKRRIGEYSGGMKQRLGLAVALFNSPQILILDEPTSALDPEGRVIILEFIKKLKDNDITIFFSTHILNDVERICDEVSILHKGKIILSDNLEKIKRNYIQPIYDIEFDRACNNAIEDIKKHDFIQKIIYKDNKASIYVKDLEKAKIELINIIASYKLPVLSFTMRKSTLEDIFIRLVNNDVNF